MDKEGKEYENINSGDPVLIAEVVRDLHKKEDSLATVVLRATNISNRVK